MMMSVCFRPKADARNKSIHESFAVTICNSPTMVGRPRLDYFQIIKDDNGEYNIDFNVRFGSEADA